MYDISIVVITYNQETTILETLESIKYQITKFGAHITFQLILADDASTDSTRAKIEKWLYKNADIFSDIVKAYLNKNAGICKNYAQAFRRVAADHFAVIAGDDLWPNINLTELILSCEEKEIIGGLPLFFKDYSILQDKRLYYSIAACSYYNEKKIIQISKYRCPVLNGFIIGKKLISEEVLRFSEQFDLLDDQARQVRMFELYKDFKYRYANLPILLYRKSDSQVTNNAGVFNTRIIQDKVGLTDYVLKHEWNPFIRIAARYERMRVSDPERFKKLWKFGYIQAYREIILYKLRKKDMDSKISEIMKLTDAQNMQEYVFKIAERAMGY